MHWFSFCIRTFGFLNSVSSNITTEKNKMAHINWSWIQSNLTYCSVLINSGLFNQSSQPWPIWLSKGQENLAVKAYSENKRWIVLNKMLDPPGAPPGHFQLLSNHVISNCLMPYHLDKRRWLMSVRYLPIIPYSSESSKIDLVHTLA